ncbi:MAG: ATP-binding protein [Rhizobiaceae bacterium]|nr:ATP-binding protein [Rhizobiaceae bacterium]
MTSHFSFNAQVSPEAIGKVGRLFNASIGDVLNELLQNARRAGATTVIIDQIDDPRFGKAVRIGDDGAGIEDPRSLFSLGSSGWSEALTQSEDAAGMGFFALANRGAALVAQQKGTADSWRIEATPDAFHGRQPIDVAPGPADHAGVTIVFPETDRDHLAGAVPDAAKFFPLPVIFNGEEMQRSDFLKNAERVEEWRGVRIGVFQHDSPYKDIANANFHGVTLRMPLPTLSQHWHRNYWAGIDVVDCAHLKLVLPARKEVVCNDMFEALVEEIHRVYFRLVSTHDAHSLSFDDYRRGLALGIDLKEAKPQLAPFRPSCADADRCGICTPMPVSPDALLYAGEGPLEEQNVARAFARTGESLPMFEPHDAFTGYGWYDRLRRITLRSYRMHIASNYQKIEPFDVFEGQDRPDILEVDVNVSDGESVCGWLLPTDLIVAGPDYGALDEVDIRVTRQSDIKPHELETFLTDALFSPSDDVDAGSYEQQQQWFGDEAEDVSVRLLQSESDADLNAILRTVRRELVWRLPKHGSFLIRIENGEVSIDGLPSALNTHGATSA